MVRGLRPAATDRQADEAAITLVACLEMVKTIFVGPGLRVEHCDRLLQVLLGHEAQARSTAMPRRTARVCDRPPCSGKWTGRNPMGQRGDVDGRRCSAGPRLTDYFRALLGLAASRTPGGFKAIANTENPGGQRPFFSLARPTVSPPVLAFVQAMARMTATLHATECFVVMRRWQLTHRGLPRALAVAAREAGLKAVPTDPYDGKPMRMAVLEGAPVVYRRRQGRPRRRRVRRTRNMTRCPAT